KYTINKHSRAINNLKINQDGSKLASGEYLTLMVVWELMTGEKLWEVSVIGEVTTICWAHFAETGSMILYFGTGSGVIRGYQESKTGDGYEHVFAISVHDGPLEDLKFDLFHSCLTSLGAGSLKVWNLVFPDQASLYIESTSRPHTARSVMFTQNGVELILCYLESHEM
ncbi:hypothetical protein BDQ17DRAFT_1215229, partial [Cyathus striatus]